MKYSVLLLYPDYLQNSDPETYYVWVEAEDPFKAVEAAQCMAVNANEEDVVEDGTDFLPLAVFEGHREMELGVADFS